MANDNPDWGYDRIVGALAIHDRDTKYTRSFRSIIKARHVTALPLPAHSPNLNTFSERWVKSVKDECLSKLILFGEPSLIRCALQNYVVHYHEERNHQSKENVLLFPLLDQPPRKMQEPVRCRGRLGGLLRYYHHEAA